MQSNRLQLNINKTELLCVLLLDVSINCRGLHFGLGLLTLSRRQRYVTLGSPSTLTSACSLTFSGLSPAVLPFCDNCAVYDDQFHRLFSRHTVRSSCLPPQPSSLCSTPQCSQSLVFVGRLTLQTLLPVFIGYELPSESSSNWRLLSTELFTALHLNICRTC